MASQKDINELLRQAVSYEKEARKILAEKTAELVKQKNISEADAKIQARKDESFKKQVERVKEIRTQLAEAKDDAKETIDVLVQQEKSLKGLTGLQASLVNHERRKIDILASGAKMSDNTRNTIQSISSLNQELLQTSREDVVTRGHLEEQIESQLKGLRNLGAAGSELKSLMEAEYQIASGVASLSEKQQEFLNKQLGVYEGIKDAVGGVLETAGLLTSGIAGAMGMIVIGAGYVVDAFSKVNRELGITLGETSKVAAQTSLIGLLGTDATGGLKQLTDEFGNMNDIAFETQLNMNLMSMYAGASTQELATLTGTFARLNGGSQDVALNMIESTRQMSIMRGVAPSAVLQDMAAATEEMATFSKGTGQNLQNAAIQARQLGLTMSKTAGVANGLLDFENSITKELELSAMLGRSINLNRARGLAYQGESTKATEEALKQLGGYNAFLKMDPIMRKQAADLINLSVADLEKAAKNQGNLNKGSESFSEKLNTWNAGINAFGSTGLGSALKGVGALIIAMGQAVVQAKLMSSAMNGNSTGGMLSSLNPFKRGGGGAGAGTPFMSAMNPQQMGPAPNPAGGGGVMSSMSKINMSAVLKGAAAMVLVAGSIFILGKALQEFSNVGLKEIGMAAAGMLLLGGAMALLGVSLGNPVVLTGILLGAAAMLIISTSIYVLGKALQEMATGFSMLSTMGSTLGGLISIIPGIMGLAGAFTVLAGSLALIAISGMAALPAMLGMAAVGAGLGFLFSAIGGDSNESGEDGEVNLATLSDNITTELQNVVNAVNNISTDVYINGQIATDNMTKIQQKEVKNLGGRGVIFS